MKLNIINKSDGSYLHENLEYTDITMGAYKNDKNYYIHLPDGKIITVDTTDYDIIPVIENQEETEKDLLIQRIHELNAKIAEFK